MSFNKYLRWQLRYSPLVNRLLYGLITFHIGASGLYKGDGLAGFSVSTVTLTYVLSVVFGFLVSLDSILFWVFSVRPTPSLHRVCAFMGRWRHVLLIPCIYSCFFQVCVAVTGIVPYYLTVALTTYSVALTLVGIILLLQDGVIDNERQQSEMSEAERQKADEKG